MNVIEFMRGAANLGYADLIKAIDVSEEQAWGVVRPASDDYLNTNGSIQSIVLHVASAKMIYGSVGFRNAEVKWSDCEKEIEAFEPSWDAAKNYLARSQEYWMESWKDISEADLEIERPHFSGKNWPTWKLIRMIIAHDVYHAGQATVLRYAGSPSQVPPPSEAADIREHCAALPYY